VRLPPFYLLAVGVSMTLSGHTPTSFRGHRKAGRVVVYTSKDCPKCAMLKRWLESKGIKFEERSIDDVVADLIMENKFILSTPALEVGGVLYSEDMILDESGRPNNKLLEELK